MAAPSTSGNKVPTNDNLIANLSIEYNFDGDELLFARTPQGHRQITYLEFMEYDWPDPNDLVARSSAAYTFKEGGPTRVIYQPPNFQTTHAVWGENEVEFFLRARPTANGSWHDSHQIN